MVCTYLLGTSAPSRYCCTSLYTSRFTHLFGLSHLLLVSLARNHSRSGPLATPQSRHDDRIGYLDICVPPSAAAAAATSVSLLYLQEPISPILLNFVGHLRYRRAQRMFGVLDTRRHLVRGPVRSGRAHLSHMCDFFYRAITQGRTQ